MFSGVPYIALCWQDLELCLDFLHLLHCLKIEGCCSILHLILFLLYSCSLCQAVLYLDAVIVRRAVLCCLLYWGNVRELKLKQAEM